MTRKRTSDNELVVSGAAAASPARRKAAARPRSKPAAEQAQQPASVEPIQAVASQPVAEIVYEATRDEIAALAYSYWEARGYRGGSPEEDWQRAEQELRLRASAATV